jgi:hypothetical protein
MQHAMFDPQWLASAPGSEPPSLGERFPEVIPENLPDPPPPGFGVGRRVREVAQPKPVPLVAVMGSLRDDELEIRSVLRIETGPVSVGHDVAGTAVELLDKQGEVMERASLRRVGLHPGCGCGCGGGYGGHGSGPASGLVQALLSDHERIASIRVMREGKELWSRRATAKAPRISKVSAELDGDDLRVRWQTTASEQHPTERHVRWSADEGRTWQALAVALPKDEAIVPQSMLTSSVALVQVLVSDGFHTVAAEPVRVEIPPRPPQVAILWPARGGTVKSGQRVRLWGVATASDGRTLSGEALRWELDGESVGAGREVWADLPEGEVEHRAVLRAFDRERVGEMSVTFVATCSGRRPAHRQAAV